MERHNKVILETVRDMLDRGDVRQAVRTVADLHSADTAEVLSGLKITCEVEVLLEMEPRAAARAMFEMDEAHQVEVAQRLGAGELRGLLESMPVDEAVDLLGDIPESRRETVLRLFGREEAEELERLLTYSDDTAGGLMTPEYISVSPEATAEEVIRLLRDVSPEVETIYYVYVTSGEGRLGGVLSLRELILSPPGRCVSEMIRPEVITVPPDTDQEEVAEVISKYDLLAVPVTDDIGRMLGIVTVDDVMDVIGDEVEEDIMRFAGATGLEEEPSGGLFAGLGRRVTWFVLTVAIEMLLVGGILKTYSPVFSKFMVLVFFIPLLVIMGGNIAVQSSTVVGRWLASGLPLQRTAAKAVIGEVIWGVLVGLLTGGLVAALSFLLDLGASVGVVVGLSLALTVIAASLVGCALPIIFRALNRDPGAVSGPLLGTIMDVLSLAIYLGIGTLLM
ncbi:MAG: magnesium transporter [Actinobacteria bacterium]|nr:magnesium transporter [Actinomycetota bacterium]MCG2817911.1 magnesium transporter [Actinomycetes bacterium]MBU4219752.1 magnesium transporter [Actinomycetota bacterium]MBU4357840.1 magnesium transporter [Actinomycetota bacterium]MBU4392667.1 magnesium transporter [Actinomycetota bacterium]